ncbi:hypothetical protein F511_04873 [Dorcoceras hygrometricum]|uniref:Ribonuclease H n=1 Tax=Dorcoceras hygrometricum TaxID=472368 RepID=A0A2Z7BK76_9LAMI|nr:hypothetical protein F511_04873 [Dorcoceras hygrometricum]
MYAFEIAFGFIFVKGSCSIAYILQPNCTGICKIDSYLTGLSPKAYVVFVGREPGVYERWSDASKQVSGFSGSCYKGFETKEDAEEAFRSFAQAPNATRVEDAEEALLIEPSS